MCITLIGSLIGALGSIVGGMATASQAKSEAQWRNYQLAVENKQLAEEQEMTRLRATEVEAQRMEQTRRMRASNLAAVAASGVAENTSFLQGADKLNDRQMRDDIGTLRLNSSVQINRIADQIAVNKAEGQFVTASAKTKGKAAMLSGFFDAAGSMVKGYSSTSYYAV